MSTHPTRKEGGTILRDLLVGTGHFPPPIWHTHVLGISSLCQQSIHMHCSIMDIALLGSCEPFRVMGARAPHQPMGSQDFPCLTPLLDSDFFTTPPRIGGDQFYLHHIRITILTTPERSQLPPATCHPRVHVT